MNRCAIGALSLLVLVASCSWMNGGGKSTADHLAVYYTKVDGTSLATWEISSRPQQNGETPAEHAHNVVLYAAVAAVAGPPADVQAIRFPAGTRVVSAAVNGSTAIVDLSTDVADRSGSALAENGEFKALVYTLTAIPGISAVQITVGGRKLQTLPGGHLELDSPLRRSDW